MEVEFWSYDQNSTIIIEMNEDLRQTVVYYSVSFTWITSFSLLKSSDFKSQYFSTATAIHSTVTMSDPEIDVQ